MSCGQCLIVQKVSNVLLTSNLIVCSDRSCVCLMEYSKPFVRPILPAHSIWVNLQLA